ncbi:MAG TPA: choice-of-anchor tandem repeat GloVer-containing protein [Terriglobales bacterium]|nr:choice-of-anchor tandem repeat GloVer-containing protein [Terriglobales bacterium]
MKPKRVVVAVAVALVLTLSLAAREAKFKILHNFGAANDGSGPFGPPVLDDEGNLYGATAAGGTGQCGDYGCGAVFELSPQPNGTWSEKLLHNFTAGSDGAIPWGGLIFDTSGDLYGTLQGDNGLGGSGVFELIPGRSGWSNIVIYTDGAGPGLLMDNARNLYGDMGPGRYEYYGAVAELSPGPLSWTYAALYSYCSKYGCPDGYDPPAPPIWDGKGNLYGTMTEGGIGKPACFSSFGCGVIFKMTPNGDGTWTYHVLHRFASSSTDGQWPYGSLVMDAAGNFYGSTWLGGANGRGNGGYGHGTVFKLAFSGGKWKETILYDFPNCNHGCMVEGTLALDKAGNLYGTAAGGTGNCGGYACGVVFKLAPQKNGKWKYSVLHDFSLSDGGVQPFYGVILDSKGNLFGVTSNFGKYNGGTAFEIMP